MTTQHGRRLSVAGGGRPSILSHPWSPDVTTNPPDPLAAEIEAAIWKSYEDAEPSPGGLVLANPRAVAALAATAARAAVSVPASAPTDPTHGLSVQHADALWDAVAIPGPHEPTFPAQHERVCRAVAEILAVLPASQTTDRAVVAERDSLGREADRLRKDWLEMRDRVEKADAALGRVRRLHDRLTADTDLASPDDRITRAEAAERIATALDTAVSGPHDTTGQAESQAERRCRLCDEPITGPGVTYFGAPDGPHFHVDREACRIAGGLPPQPVVGQGATDGDAPQPAVVSQPDEEA